MKPKKSNKIEKFTLFDLIVHLILIAVSVCILYPMLHVVAVSFSDSYHIMADDVTIFPRGFTLESYAYFLGDSKVIRAYGNSIVYTAVGVMINVIMTVLMAYPLSKSRLAGRSTIMKLILFTMYFSGGTIPTYLVVKELKLLNSIWSLVLPNAIWTMELIIVINFFRSIPVSLYEAAELDGANEFQIFRRIALPLSKASIASISLFYFMGHWNSYYLPMLYLNDTDKFPLQLILRSMLLEGSENLTNNIVNTNITPSGVKNAVIVLAMIPVMFVYPFVQKYFVKGVMIGSVKE